MNENTAWVITTICATLLVITVLVSLVIDNFIESHVYKQTTTVSYPQGALKNE